MMDVPETIKSISERLQNAATVKTIYGDPIDAEGKTIIPVARVRYGFGAGGGSGPVPGAQEPNPTKEIPPKRQRAAVVAAAGSRSAQLE